jgi:hypothetical protein
MKNRTALETIFNVDDEEHITRSRLKDRVLMQDKIVRYLTEELFYADPYHPSFREMSEGEKAGLRTMTIIRRGIN